MTCLPEAFAIIMTNIIMPQLVERHRRWALMLGRHDSYTTVFEVPETHVKVKSRYVVWEFVNPYVLIRPQSAV